MSGPARARRTVRSQLRHSSASAWSTRAAASCRSADQRAVGHESLSVSQSYVGDEATVATPVMRVDREGSDLSRRWSYAGRKPRPGRTGSTSRRSDTVPSCRRNRSTAVPQSEGARERGHRLPGGEGQIPVARRRGNSLLVATAARWPARSARTTHVEHAGGGTAGSKPRRGGRNG